MQVIQVPTEAGVKIEVGWKRMQLDQLPECCGVYAITDEFLEKWYYIGKSENICKRIAFKNHPAQVTKDINLGQCYYYVPFKAQHISWLERYLIREYQPAWNGGTARIRAFQSQWLRCDLKPPTQEIPYHGNVWDECA